ncbi:hypothetical protein [Lacisediminihabitans sp. H27-G8]|uniref:hypothetical protein n=1 Tax=Lacisediminihabitans sp. H27-G8 TaxID=3111909 RepID=UPI0038FCABEF
MSVVPSVANQAACGSSRISRVPVGAVARAVARAGPEEKSASSGWSLAGLIQTVATPATVPSAAVIGATQVLVIWVGSSVFAPER